MSSAAASVSKDRTPSPPSRHGLLVAVLAFTGIAVSLQQTLIIPVVPLLPGLLDVPADDASWTVTATLLGAAVATPLVGRLADMMGKRRMLLVCLYILIVGSAVAALSTSLPLLLAGRLLQGLAGGIVPLGISLMRDVLPADRLPSAAAQMSASLGVGGALGLPLAAVVVEYADWHAVFWVSALLGAIGTVLVLVLVPESPEYTPGHFDIVGGAALAGALVCLLLAMSKGGAFGWTSATTLALAGGGVLLAVAWAIWELRVPQPLVDLRVNTRRQVLVTNIASLVFGFALLTSSLVFPQLIQLPESTGYGFGQSILVSGLLLAPGGLVMMAMSPLSARLSRAAGARTSLLVGALTVAVGYLFAAGLHSHIWHLLVAVLVVSSGVGLAYSAIPMLIMASVPVAQTAAANSFNAVVRAIGTAIASATAGMVLSQVTVTTNGAELPAESGFVIVLVLGAASALLAVAVILTIPRARAAESTQSTQRNLSGEL